MNKRNEDIEIARQPDTPPVQKKNIRTFSNPHALHFKKWSRHTKALIALALVCFFWGTTWLASKEGVRHMPALQLVGIRQSLAGLCYVLFFVAKGTTWPRGKEWRIILMLSFLNFMLSNGLSTWGVKYISAGLGSIIGAIVPLWLVVINIVGTRAKIQPKVITGLLLGFAGICVIFYEHLGDFLNPQFRFGIMLSLAATWSWAFGTIYTKKHATGFNPYFSLGWQMLISGLFVTLVCYATGATIPVSHIPWQSWSAIAYLVGIGSVVAFAAFLYALQHLPTEQSSIYSYINPVVAVLLGWLLFGEMLTPFIIIGVLLTLYGVYLVNKAAVKPHEIA
jgi:drug/metabolite transporter (DMT)-like permease